MGYENMVSVLLKKISEHIHAESLQVTISKPLESAIVCRREACVTVLLNYFFANDLLKEYIGQLILFVITVEDLSIDNRANAIVFLNTYFRARFHYATPHFLLHPVLADFMLSNTEPHDLREKLQSALPPLELETAQQTSNSCLPIAACVVASSPLYAEPSSANGAPSEESVSEISDSVMAMPALAGAESPPTNAKL